MKVNVTIEYGTTSDNNVTITRPQAIREMKKIAGEARAGLYLCQDVTVKLRDVQIKRRINVTSIIAVFYLQPKVPSSTSLSNSDIDCIKGVGIFMDLKADPERNTPMFNEHSGTAAFVTYGASGLCCQEGLVENGGICGE